MRQVGTRFAVDIEVAVEAAGAPVSVVAAIIIHRIMRGRQRALGCKIGDRKADFMLAHARIALRRGTGAVEIDHLSVRQIELDHGLIRISAGPLDLALERHHVAHRRGSLFHIINEPVLGDVRTALERTL